MILSPLFSFLKLVKKKKTGRKMSQCTGEIAQRLTTLFALVEDWIQFPVSIWNFRTTDDTALL